jgi:hypothetical protein
VILVPHTLDRHTFDASRDVGVELRCGRWMAFYYNVERPDGSAGQQLKFVVVLLYPR